MKYKKNRKIIISSLLAFSLVVSMIFPLSFSSVFAAETSVIPSDETNSDVLSSQTAVFEEENKETLEYCDQNDIDYSDDTFVVWTKDKLDFEDYNGVVVSQTQFGDEWMTVLKTEGGKELLESMTQAQQSATDESDATDEDSIIVEPNLVIDAQFVPNDPGVKNKNLYYYEANNIDVYSAWDILPSSGTKVKVGVVDTGVNPNHEELKGIVDTASSRTIQNGKVTKKISDRDPESYHGTAVCGVIAARSNNGIGTAGIASGKNNSIVSLVVCSAGSTESFLASDIALSIKHLTDSGCKVINLSVGDGTPGMYNKIDKTEKTALDYASGKGVAVVASAGNEGSTGLTYPSDYPSVISVISTSSMADRSNFSSYGVNKDIATFGQNILVPAESGKTMKKMSGTSFSAPAITGVIALMQYKAANKLTIRQIKNILYSSTNNGAFSNDLGFGVIKVGAAVKNTDYVVKYNIAPTGIKTNRTSVSVALGSSTTVESAITPAYTKNPGLTYKSANEKIFKVNSNGGITPVAAGKANLTVSSTAKPSIKKTIPVTVYKPTFAELKVKSKIGTGKDSGKVILSWNNVANDATYKIYGSTDNKKFSFITSTKKLTATVKLGYGKSYFYVVPTKGDKTGIKSDSVGFSLNTSLKIYPKDAGTKTQGILWQTVNGADGYQIVKYDPKQKKDVHVKYVSAKANSTTTPGRTGTYVAYRVRPYRNFIGKKTFASYSVRKSMTPTPKKPVSVKYKYSGHKVNIHVKPMKDSTGVAVYRAVSNKKTQFGKYSFYKKVQTHGKTSEIIIKDHSKRSKTYVSYKVYSYKKAGKKEYLSHSFFTTSNIKVK